MRDRALRVTAALAATGTAASLALTWAASSSASAMAQPSPAAMALSRQVLPASDGWAASGTGTTGGSTADAAHVVVASNRTQLVAALGGDNTTNAANATPKIIFISGKIRGNVRDDGTPLTCADYAAPGYDLDAFLSTYDPSVWGRVLPSGPLEDARATSAKNQTERVKIYVGSNTTIIGLPGAKLTGINLMVNKVSNVIVRNLTLEDARDCFPAWDPTDGASGNWNSLYDTASVIGSTNVWFDHDTFSDGNDHDSSQPLCFGRPYQWHDGLLDITKASDLVTVEYSVFADHDKTMLIGSTNTVGADVGKLRVTLHHNRFANVGQRAPRVRFGQVDVYDNYYVATDEKTYTYSWGVGVYSAIYAENNVFLRSADIPLDAIVHNWGGTGITEIGTLTRIGTQPLLPTSVVSDFNAVHDPDLGTDAGWVPTLREGPVDPATAVPALVSANAGAGKLKI